MALRELRDPIHGFVARSDVEQELIDSPVFQRLRRIRQLALASLVYPGALHTRFDHSIGAMHVAGKIAEAIDLKPDQTRLVRLAALLHDVGHGPFSHVSEPILESFTSVPREKQKTQIHEILTKEIILTDKSLARVLSHRDREIITGILEGKREDSVLLRSFPSSPFRAKEQETKENVMLLLIIVLILLFGGGGGYYGYSNYGLAGGIVPIILVVLVIWLLLGRGGL